ncbi:MAG: glucosaminidase domain-containing protein [Proteobacteria bacterium]|nr:glucosaminidase domain-containing protein [Pseudomonadota bacterium]MBU1688040.1 glucosaminidase domain-containing protein [Pseudomonadota bacterium]
MDSIPQYEILLSQAAGSNSPQTAPVAVLSEAILYVRFGNYQMSASLAKVGVVGAFFLLFLIMISMGYYLPEYSRPSRLIPAVPLVIEADSGQDLVRRLKEFQLWRIDPSQPIPPVTFTGYPENMNELEISLKKKLFFHALLPSAMIVRDEIEQERETFRQILNKFENAPDGLYFSDEIDEWGLGLSATEIEFVMAMTHKYRSRKANQLLNRINVIPLSLIMAQAAIESSWGSSRFARLGNNLFGVWTWGNMGLIPIDRDEDKKHKVAVYDSILDSVRAYMITLNRLPAYREFREIRSRTMDPMLLADGLTLYSERRDEYVAEVKDFILVNSLLRYDDFVLDREGTVYGGAGTLLSRSENDE